MILDFFNNLDRFKDGEKFTVDRFENNSAVLENRETGIFFNVSIFKLPNNLKEGDILLISNGSFILDNQETLNVQEAIQSKFDRLKKKK